MPIEIFSKKIPILGICYGLQLIAKLYGGKIKSSKRKREFGRAFIFKKRHSEILYKPVSPEKDLKLFEGVTSKGNIN